MVIHCENCGAALDVDGSQQYVTCSYCKKKNMVAHPSPLAPLQNPLIAPRATKDESTIWMIAISVGVGVVGIVGVLIGISRVKPPSTTQKTGDERAYAEPNSACGSLTGACSTDKKSMLHCDGQKLLVALTCKGPNGCRATNQGESVNCDYTYADENDPCNVSDSACSTDHKSELKCDGTKFVVSSACGGPDGCSVAMAAQGYTLTCDDHVASENAPCLEDGRMACSTDSKSLLRCTRGHFSIASACAGPKHCAIEKDAANATTTVDCDKGKR